MAVGTVNVAFPFGTDMDQFDVGLLAQGAISGQTSTSYTVTLGPEVVVIGGTGFTFDGSGNPTGGTVTSLQDQFQGLTNLSVTGLSVSIATLNTWALADDKTSAFNGFFGGSDTLTGGPLADQLRGYGGNDSISGGAGDDTIDGGAGNDTLAGGGGHDVFITGGGADSIIVNYHDSALTAAGADVVNGWTSTDILTFGSGPAGSGDYTEISAADFGSALTAANQLIATGAQNVVAVQVGSDVVVFADSGNDNGGADDAIILAGKTLADISVSNITLSPSVVVTPPPTTPPPTTPPPTSPPPVTPPPVVTTGAGGGGTTTSSAPTTGNDNLVTTSTATEIHAGAGNDTITNNLSSASYLRGDDGDDSISGGSGFDDINGNVGNDTAHGNAGDDWVVGGKDNDMLFGDAGGDIVWGNLGNDTLDGGDGADQVRGGQGDDVLTGGAGDDFLSGDRGSDTITGGAGADIFHTFAQAGYDRVLDFNAAEGDRVMLDAGTAYVVYQSGADVMIDMGGGNQMALANVQLASLPAGWIFSG